MGGNVSIVRATCSTVSSREARLALSDSPEAGNKFRSALGVDDLAAVILQFAMLSRHAEKTLTDNLAHLFLNHQAGYKREGVWVSGAGIAQLNGWYRCLDRAPDSDSDDSLDAFTEGRPYYRKDDG